MFVKPSKKWRNHEGDDSIMAPYTFYRLYESFRDVGGKTKQRTVLGLGELPAPPTHLSRNRNWPTFAAAVNKEGLLVRTEIFEGNRQDVSTLEDVDRVS